MTSTVSLVDDTNAKSSDNACPLKSGSLRMFDFLGPERLKNSANNSVLMIV